jgi:DNA repair protein RadD
LRVGLIAAGYPHDRDADLWVCSVQTIIGRPDLTTGYDFMVLDEAHHCVSVTWRRLIADNPSAKLFGVTATPTRLDGRGLGEKVGGVFQELLIGAYPEALIRDGWLAPTRCFVGARIDIEGLRTKMGDWSDRDVAERAMNARLIGDQVEEYRKFAEGMTCLVFGATVDHATMLAESLRRRRVSRGHGVGADAPAGT